LLCFEWKNEEVFTTFHSHFLHILCFFKRKEIWYGIYTIYSNNVLSDTRGASQLLAEKYPLNLIRVMPAKGSRKNF